MSFLPPLFTIEMVGWLWPNTSFKDWGVNVMWTTPVVTEIAVGLEINCYACADL